MPETVETPVTERVNQAPITDEVLNVRDFNDRIVGAYNDGSAELGLPADDSFALVHPRGHGHPA